MGRHFKFLPILLVTMLASSVSGQYLIASINCGGSKGTTDSNSITWTPDDTLISNGLAQTVQPYYSLSDPVLDSLRVFTSRKKNCYTIGEKLQGVKVLVRATFHYGNYDRLSAPPVFDLHFDGNFWATIQTKLSGGIYEEITYVAKRDNVSVCVAQTNLGQLPFISSLEVRKLDSEVYSEVDKSKALRLIRRDSYGASKETRYPADKYDRIWQPPNLGLIDVLTNEASSVDTTDEPNHPPSEVFEHAMTVKTTLNSLYVGTVYASSPPVYANMYFSEVINFASTRTRSFRVFDTSGAVSSWLTSDPVSPPYGKVLKLNYPNYTVDSTRNVYLIATADSYYPPIINAFESFYVMDDLTDGTHSNDVAGLALLQSTFKVLGGWRGDPCLPAGYSWDWLSCSDDATPRVTSLYLDSFGLSGSLPDISSMDALEIIDLHNNSLSGSIPSFLGNMANLEQLNLADNKFTGPIPTSLSKNNKLRLTVDGNPMCASGKSCPSSPGTINSSPGSTSLSRKKKSSKLPLIFGITIPVFVLVWVAAGVYVIMRRRIKPAMPVVTGGGAKRGGSNGDSDGEEMKETTENVIQQPHGSPSPLLDTSGQSSNLYGH